MKKTLITGGAGFIGLHLSRHLAKQGYQVTILDNFARSKEDEDLKEVLSMPNVTFIKADITLPSTFSTLPKDFDYVYHLAAINGTENFYKIPVNVLKVGILGTLNILDWFVTCGKGKILFSSSSETYAGYQRLHPETFPIPTSENVPLVVEDPTNVRWSYGGSKILGEVAFHCYAKQFELRNFVIIRYHNIFGPRMGNEHVIPQFIERAAKRENPFKIYGGNETRTFCYVNDAVRATQTVMESSAIETTIHIGRSDGELSIQALAQLICSHEGYSPNFSILEAPKGCVLRRCPDISKLQKKGFLPEVSLQEGIVLTHSWYKQRIPANPHTGRMCIAK